MTVLQGAAADRRPPGWNESLWYRVLFLLGAGGVIGFVVGLGLYGTKTSYVVLLPFGLALLLPPLCMRNFRLYWLAVFLLSLQFTISKNLNDGLAVLASLKIDAFIPYFTFDVTATDLVLAVMLLIWANDRIFHGKPMRFPGLTWLAVGYLGICLLSIIGSDYPYLGFVEMARQSKFFIVYLYAVNCVDSKKALRAIIFIGVIILVTQGAMTLVRFETGYMAPLTFGNTYQDLSQITQYLSVDRFDPNSAVRAYGTLGSPGSTIRLSMMVIPFALFLCVRNAIFKMRFLFLALAGFGILGLILTFTRVYFITTAVQVALAFLIMIRDRMLKPWEVILVVLVGLAAIGAVSQKLYYEFTVREDSMSVRLKQYEATVNIIADYPWFGVGLNNGVAAKKRYNKVTYNPYDANTQFDQEPTHNLYLSLASEIGILGLMVFVAFFSKVTLLAWRQSRYSTDPEIRFFANALVVVFASVAITGCMDPLHEYPFLVLLWLYAGITFNLPLLAEGGESAAAISRRGAQTRFSATAIR